MIATAAGSMVCRERVGRKALLRETSHRATHVGGRCDEELRLGSALAFKKFAELDRVFKGVPAFSKSNRVGGGDAEANCRFPGQLSFTERVASRRSGTAYENECSDFSLVVEFEGLRKPIRAVIEVETIEGLSIHSCKPT